MFNKLKANFNLSNLLVRIFYVLAVVLASWQGMLGTLYHAFANMPAFAQTMAQLSGNAKLTVALFSSALEGVVLMFVTPFLAGLFLNIAKIYTVPRAEFGLIVNLYCAIGFFVTGLLNLINLITPLFLVWGGVIFPFIVTLGCFVSFYLVTSKMYFNDVTKVYYFKCILVVAIIVLVLEVL